MVLINRVSNITGITHPARLDFIGVPSSFLCFFLQALCFFLQEKGYLGLLSVFFFARAVSLTHKKLCCKIIYDTREDKNGEYCEIRLQIQSDLIE